jgi:hypothetical protein
VSFQSDQAGSRRDSRKNSLQNQVFTWRAEQQAQWALANYLGEKFPAGKFGVIE